MIRISVLNAASIPEIVGMWQFMQAATSFIVAEAWHSASS